MNHIPPNCSYACCGPVNHYCQCRLSKKSKDGEYRMISWIPKEFALKNKILKLFDGEKWDDGWQVTSVGNCKFGRDRQDNVMCECGHFC